MDNQTPPVTNPPTETSPVQSATSTTPPAKSFLPTKIILLIVAFLILIVGGGTYLTLNFKPKQAPVVSKSTPTFFPTPAPDPTASWKTYINPEFKYSLKIPPELKEVSDSDNEQKRFREYTNAGNSSDENGVYEAELQILTLSFEDTAFTGTKADFEKYLNLAASESANLQGTQAVKIKNIYLDTCLAPQFYLNEGNYKYLYSTSCAGEKRYLSVILFTDNPITLEKYKQTYELIIESFKFNQFQL